MLGRRDRAAISVYARNRDYHDVLEGRLKHLAQFIASRFGALKVFVDTAPVMEKPLHQRAGLGWQGKHTNLVSRRHGSWLFLAELYTTLEIPPDAPHADRCGTCARCLAACPTDAFPAPYQLDATRCISYLTIEHRGPIPHALRPAMGNRIYGCDDCLAVCPWNRFAQAEPGGQAARAPRSHGPAAWPNSRRWTTPPSARAFTGSPIKRIGRNRFVRNVAIAIGNSGDAALRPAAARLAADPDPVVAEAAAWAVARKLRKHRMMAAAAEPVLVKRSLTLSGHRTSVALEPEFWDVLAAIAARRGRTLAALVAETDAARGNARPLASALRVRALQEVTRLTDR